MFQESKLFYSEHGTRHPFVVAPFPSGTRYPYPKVPGTRTNKYQVPIKKVPIRYYYSILIRSGIVSSKSTPYHGFSGLRSVTSIVRAV